MLLCKVFRVVYSRHEEVRVFVQWIVPWCNFLHQVCKWCAGSGNDYHPDAHACRLKLSVVTVGLGGDGSMTCPWSVTEEMEEYCKKHPHASAACRLSAKEELLLLQLFAPMLEIVSR